MLTITSQESLQKPIMVAHISDFTWRYPSEALILYTQITINQPVLNFSLRLTLPETLLVGQWAVPKMDVETDSLMWHTKHYHDPVPNALPVIDSDAPAWKWHNANHPPQPEIYGTDDGRLLLTWQFSGKLAPGTYNHELYTIIPRTKVNLMLETEAKVTALTLDDATVGDIENNSVQVKPKSNYLYDLPAVYERDNFMGRYLMIFESMWKPIDGTINALPNYFDFHLAPKHLLPWLSTWLGIEQDEICDEDKLRELLLAAPLLQRGQSTKAALQKWIEICTGVVPKITEHGAFNFELGQTDKLGTGIALGRDNQPYTFTVALTLPPVTISDPTAPDAKKIRERKEQERRRMIERIIKKHKPAHTTYTLIITLTDKDSNSTPTKQEETTL